MTQLGKYELHEKLGRGGFGTVYRASDTSLGREVALKVLHPELMIEEGFIERFRKEARVLASLDSHNIVTLYDMGEVDGRIFISMRYLSGGSLKKLIQEKGAISFDQALSIFGQILIGLREAHAKGLVHRDLKPENILFDAHQEAVITDYGLVRDTNSSTTGTPLSIATIIGTPSYIAPEIWSGEPATAVSDIYALGCILFEMITGKMLVKGNSLPVVMKQHMDGIKMPVLWPEGVPKGFVQVIQKALAINPQERFQTVEEFEKALAMLSTEFKSGAAQRPQDNPVQHNNSQAGNGKQKRNSLFVAIGALVLVIVGAIILLIIKTSQQSASLAAATTMTQSQLLIDIQSESIKIQPTLTKTPTLENKPTEGLLVTPTVEPVFGQIKGNANCRYAPGLDYSLIRTLSNGIIVPIIGKNNDGSWVNLRIEPTTINSGLVLDNCWVSSGSIDITGKIIVVLTTTPAPLTIKYKFDTTETYSTGYVVDDGNLDYCDFNFRFYDSESEASIAGARSCSCLMDNWKPPINNPSAPKPISCQFAVVKIVVDDTWFR